MPINTSVSTESITEMPKSSRVSYTKEFAKVFAFCALVSSTQYLLPLIAAYKIDPQSIMGIGYGIVTLGSLYGLMGFVRVLAAGYTTQSKTKNDEERYWSSFIEISLISVMLGIVIIIFKKPIFHAMMLLNTGVSETTREYYNVAILASPIHMLNFGVIGWFIGHKKFKSVFFIHIFGSFFMIFAGSTFIPVWELGAIGIAISTTTSQIFLFVISLFVVLRIIPKEKRILRLYNFKASFNPVFFASIYLLLRTVFLIVQMNIDHSMAGRLGEPLWSANNILVQLLFLASSIFEGVACASSIFICRAIVKKNVKLTRFTFKLTNYFTVGTGVVIAALFFMFREVFINFYASTDEISHAAIIYSMWLLPYFLMGGFSMTYYGFFIGANNTKPIMTSVGISVIVFVFAHYVTNEVLLKLRYSSFDALWMSYTVFYIIRGIALYLKRDTVFQLVPYTDDLEVMEK